MTKTATLHMKVEPELLEAIDNARGDINRTRWVERAIEDKLRQTHEDKKWASLPPLKKGTTPSLADTWRR